VCVDLPWNCIVRFDLTLAAHAHCFQGHNRRHGTWGASREREPERRRMRTHASRASPTVQRREGGRLLGNIPALTSARRRHPCAVLGTATPSSFTGLKHTLNRSSLAALSVQAQTWYALCVSSKPPPCPGPRRSRMICHISALDIH
jgi:hypothetical protein